jgi:hypothetical protein
MSVLSNKLQLNSAKQLKLKCLELEANVFILASASSFKVNLKLKLKLVLQRVIKYPGTRHVGTRPGPEFKRFGITRTRPGPGCQYPGVPESLESSNFLKKIYNLEQKCVNFLNPESSEKILPLREKK